MQEPGNTSFIINAMDQLVMKSVAETLIDVVPDFTVLELDIACPVLHDSEYNPSTL